MRALVLFHRWVGVALCLMFAAWFLTGAMMVFIAFPSLPGPERAARSALITAGQIGLLPGDAAALLGEPDDLRLIARAGTTAYVGTSGGHAAAVDASTGRRLPMISAEQASRAASAFGGAAVRSVSGPVDYDQWVVHQQFDPLRPLYRVRLATPDHRDLYVSARTGEIVQQTRDYERTANWAGSVVHWVYYVPLRRSFAAWDWTVWIVALVGLTSVAAGLWLGVRASLRRTRSSTPARSPFRGLVRWHHLLGLAAGIFVLAWITSGWLSMDHGRLFSDGQPSPQVAKAYAGAGSLAKLSLDDVRGVARGATRIEFEQVSGCQVAGAQGPTPTSRSACASGGTSSVLTLVGSALRSAWPSAEIGRIRSVVSGDAYAKAEGLPPGTLVATIRTPNRLRVYANPETGRLLVVMDRSRAAYAWLYYMLHTYNYPGLADRPALRITLLLIPLALGFGFACTGVLVGLRRIGAFHILRPRAAGLSLAT